MLFFGTSKRFEKYILQSRAVFKLNIGVRCQLKKKKRSIQSFRLLSQLSHVGNAAMSRGLTQGTAFAQPGDIFSNFYCVPKLNWGHPAKLKGHLTRFVKGTLGYDVDRKCRIFCWIKALSANSDHCRAMGCRIGG